MGTMRFVPAALVAVPLAVLAQAPAPKKAKTIDELAAMFDSATLKTVPCFECHLPQAVTLEEDAIAAELAGALFAASGKDEGAAGAKVAKLQITCIVCHSERTIARRLVSGSPQGKVLHGSTGAGRGVVPQRRQSQPSEAREEALEIKLPEGVRVSEVAVGSLPRGPEPGWTGTHSRGDKTLTLDR